MENPARRLKTIIVEDSPRMQEILIRAVQTRPGLELVEVVNSAAAALEFIAAFHADLVILDLVLQQGSGLEIIGEIKRRLPGCRVLVFTGYDAEQYRLRCEASGADHFFSKNRQHRELIDLLNDLGGQATPSL